ncbi:hypothetical protein [Vibrio parahaemolyticus]|uniref:hypothetical protein n=1 Tax=Vibrio parahaemolyticus TaxID=670 RepID=UPI001EEB2F6B|nr:hypothetical protein [Vibrio parahaemolyticus]MCG6439242.1 hypothetical protein [Vibrio parahaemolyticus]
MKSVILSTLGLIVVTSSPIAAANTLDREEWSSDGRQDFSERRAKEEFLVGEYSAREHTAQLDAKLVMLGSGKLTSKMSRLRG